MKTNEEILATYDQLSETLVRTRAYIGRVAGDTYEGLKLFPAADYPGLSEDYRRIALPDEPVVDHGFMLKQTTTRLIKERRINWLAGLPLRHSRLVAVRVEHPDAYHGRSLSFSISTNGSAKVEYHEIYTTPMETDRKKIASMEAGSVRSYANPDHLRQNYSTKMLGALATTRIVAGILEQAYKLQVDTSESLALTTEWRTVDPTGNGQIEEHGDGHPFYPALLLANAPEFYG